MASHPDANAVKMATVVTDKAGDARSQKQLSHSGTPAFFTSCTAHGIHFFPVRPDGAALTRAAAAQFPFSGKSIQLLLARRH